METIIKLLGQILELPIYLYITAVGGYIGYITAMHGRRENEKKSDLVFGSLLFGLPALFAVHLSKHLEFTFWWMVLAVGGSIILCVGSGMAWRKWIRKFAYRTLNVGGISNDTGDKSVWTGITQDSDVRPKQITVFTRSGQKLICEDTDEFSEAHIDYFSWDDDGNIAMYVTHIGENKVSDPIIDEHGESITFIPASEIIKVRLRLKKV